MNKKYKDKGRKSAGKRSTKNERRDVEIRDTAEREFRTDKYDAYHSKPNDPRWYASSEQLLRDAASYPYAYPLGTLVDYGANAAVSGSDMAQSIPGIMAIKTSITYGNSQDAVSPLNMAAKNIYSFVVHANSRNYKYDAPDLMLYLAAIDSLNAHLSFMKRIYGTAMLTSPVNRYYPQAAVTAMNVDYNDIRQNLSDLRTYINVTAARIGSLVVPANMSFMAKHEWMYAGIYADAPTGKAQTYMFVPATYNVYELDGDGAGYLHNYNLWGESANTPESPSGEWKLLTYADLRFITESMLNPILNTIGDQDFGMMGADILRAYGPEGVHRVEMIPENYSVYPVFDEEVLQQIQNCSAVGPFEYNGATAANPTTADNKANLTQSANKNYLVYNPSFQRAAMFNPPDVTENTFADTMDQTITPTIASRLAGFNILASNRVITFNKESITPADTMEATRMTNILELPATGSAVTTCLTLGSEVVHDFAIYYYGYDDSNNWVLKGVNHIEISKVATVGYDVASSSTSQHPLSVGNAATLLARWASELSVFDYHPAVCFATSTLLSNSPNNTTWAQVRNSAWGGYCFDVSNYTVIDKQGLIEMAQVALLSEFDVTQFGTKMTFGK